MNICIIGSGLLGLSLAYKIDKKFTNSNIIIIEKENNISKHQSSNNSGVLHCGLDYKPGSLKAKVSTKGIKQMVSFCKENKINHELCGKIVVSTSEAEDKTIENLASYGKKNGLKGLRFLTKNELKKREPNVFARKALLVPEEGIVDFLGVSESFKTYLQSKGHKILLGNKYFSLIKKNKKDFIVTDNYSYEYDLIFNCSGLHSDRVYKKMTGKNPPFKIIPFRGEYFKFKETHKNIINHLVYPTPNPNFPFLGVHFTRMIDKKVTVGPNAVLSFKREGYKFTDFNLYDLYESISYRGLINFVLKNFSFSINQFQTSMSRIKFVNQGKKMIPDLRVNMLEKSYSGVRAQGIDRFGNLIMDLELKKKINKFIF